jgi:hypothetical protein
VQLAPYQLIGRNGITAATRAWSLRERFRCQKCKRRPPHWPGSYWECWSFGANRGRREMS